MELIPIWEGINENKAFIRNPLCRKSIFAVIGFYKKVEFFPLDLL